MMHSGSEGERPHNDDRGDGTKRVFFREAIVRALREEMQHDDSVFLLGQDIAEFGGPYKETKGLHELFGSDRVRNTPVAEATMMGVAVGAAASGMRPIVCITYMDFLMIGFDALINYAAKIRYKTGDQLNAPMVVKTTAGAKGQGVAHSQCIESWLLAVPGLKVVAPSNPTDAYGLLKTAIRDPGPVVFVDHKRLFKTAGYVPTEERVTPIGTAAVVREGTDVTVVCHSYMTSVALGAAQHLAAQGISTEVVDLRSLSPLDIPTVRQSVHKTKAVLFLEEGQEVCGIGSELAFRLRDLDNVKMTRIGARRLPVSSAKAIEDYCVPSPDRVVNDIVNLLGRHVRQP